MAESRHGQVDIFINSTSLNKSQSDSEIRIRNNQNKGVLSPECYLQILKIIIPQMIERNGGQIINLIEKNESS